MKALKLTLAALTSAITVLFYFFLTDDDRLRRTYLCFKQATSIAACYQGESVDFVADIDGIRYEGNLRNGIDNDIFYYGAYEKPILYFLRDIMGSAYRNQGTFIDVGANTGQHSLFMSRYASAVHAFEPWEPVLKRFRRMVEINRIKNIVIHPVGLGDQNSKKRFYKPAEKNLGTGSFVEGFVAENSFEGELEIQIGDEALEKSGVNYVSLIKMDIEGYEKPALRGLRRTLVKYRPIVEFELTADPNSSVSIKSKNELIALFPENYDFLVVSEKSDLSTGNYILEAIDGSVRFDRKGRHDMVAYPLERQKNITLRAPLP
ncbi:MAG: FkbM family methyltransferase [Candidatus Binatia bacterium]